MCARRLLYQRKSSTYAFREYYHELDKSAVLQENKELRGQEKMLEDNVVNKVTKRLKIEEKLRQALARSEKSCGHYKKRSKNLSIT